MPRPLCITSAGRLIRTRVFTFLPQYFLFLAGSVILLSGCAYLGNDTEITAHFQPMAPGAQQAGLYIYRPPSMSNALYTSDIAIDATGPNAPDLDTKISQQISLKNGQLKHLQLPAGAHTVTLLAAGNFSHNQPVTLTMKTGETYYLRIATSLKIDQSAGYQPYQRRFDLQQVSTDRAIAQINDCCFSARSLKKSARAAQPPAQKASTEKPGFSVDKTQNPFSH